MIFVACYTKDTPYEEEVEKLRSSLEHHGLQYDIQPYEHRGSWLANCHYIPIFCRMMMDKHPGESLVYLDADAVVRVFPGLLFEIDRENQHDFAVYHLPRKGEVHRRGRIQWKEWRELLDGTMFLRNIPEVRELVDKWIARDAEEILQGTWEQKVLEVILQKNKSLRWKELPPEYCFIFDNETQARAVTSEPVIVHYQASRRFRKVLPSIASTESFLRKLPQPFAVVGNASSFKEGDGERIDQFPTVIRMNNFQLEGFAPLVGKKLTAWCVNGWKDVPYREFGIPVFTPFGQRDIYSLDEWRDRCPHLISSSSQWGRITHEFSGKEPSTGLVLMNLLDTLGIEATAFGFDSFQTGHYWKPEPFQRTPIHRLEESKNYTRFSRVRVG